MKAAVDFMLTVKGSLGFEQAQVCSGGVATDEINPQLWNPDFTEVFILQGNFLILTEHAEAITFSGHGPAKRGRNARSKGAYLRDQPAEASGQSYGSRPETEN